MSSRSKPINSNATSGSDNTRSRLRALLNEFKGLEEMVTIAVADGKSDDDIRSMVSRFTWSDARLQVSRENPGLKGMALNEAVFARYPHLQDAPKGYPRKNI